MKKYILVILPMIMVSSFSFGRADGDRVSEFQPNSEIPESCNVSNLGVWEDETTSDMDARFRPNIITINWANTQGAAVGSGTQKTTNQYDAGIEKPTKGILRKTGYKFVGWKVSGVKTCADFSSYEKLCKEHQNCIWKNSACVPNPCVIIEADEFSTIYNYGKYDYEAGDCAYNVLQ